MWLVPKVNQENVLALWRFFLFIFFSRCFALENRLGPQVGGSVRHAGDPWHPLLGQQSCNPFLLQQSQPQYSIPARNSRDDKDAVSAFPAASESITKMENDLKYSMEWLFQRIQRGNIQGIVSPHRRGYFFDWKSQKYFSSSSHSLEWAFSTIGHWCTPSSFAFAPSIALLLEDAFDHIMPNFLYSK